MHVLAGDIGGTCTRPASSALSLEHTPIDHTRRTWASSSCQREPISVDAADLEVLQPGTRDPHRPVTLSEAIHTTPTPVGVRVRPSADSAPPTPPRDAT